MKEHGTTPKFRKSPHDLKNKFLRQAWSIVYTLLFRPSPRPLHAWRRCLIVCFGGRVGKGVKIYPSSKIWAPWNLILQDYAAIGDNTNCYNVATITIGEYATVSQDSVLCTASHDSKQLHLPLLSSEIVIDSYAWICADTFIMPGVVVGRGAIVGARSTVFSDVAPWTIEGGSPSKEIRKRYLNPQQEILDLDKANYEQ